MKVFRLIFYFLILASFSWGTLFAISPADERVQDAKFSGKIKGFRVPEYFSTSTGEKSRIRSLLFGREATPVGKGLILIKGLRIECYNLDGTTNTVITTPSCTYSVKDKMVESEEVLHLYRTDETLSIQGKGFSWNHQQLFLTISNQVLSDFSNIDMSGFSQLKTENHLTKNEKSTNRVRVTSDTFTFDQKQYNAQYIGHVNITESNSRLRCGKLQLISEGKTNLFEQITGENNVEIQVDKPDQRFTASGDQFIYSRSQEELAISGNVRWSADNQKGSADFVTLRENGHDLSATGNVKMELKKNEIESGGLIGIPMANKDKEANDFLTSFSDNLNSHTNRISLFGNVAVKDGDASLDCETLNIYFKDQDNASTENEYQVEWIEALGRVKIYQKTHRIETQHAIYKATDSTANFDQHVRWYSDDLQGEADQISMWNEPRHALAEGHIIVIMPVEGKIQPLELFGPLDNNSGTKQTQNTKVEHELQITSDKMRVSEEQVHFQENVVAKMLPADTEITQMKTASLLLDFKEKDSAEEKTSRYLDTLSADNGIQIMQTTFNPEPKIQSIESQKMVVQLDSQTGTVKNAVAMKNVKMEQENVKATGDRAFFDSDTQLLELTGNPVAKMPNGTLYADKMIWDRKTSLFKAVSRFRIDGSIDQKNKFTP